MKKIFKNIARAKVYVVRSSSYLSILNFTMIIATFKATYNINISNFVLVPCGITAGLFMGYLDYILILRHEIEINNKKNNVKEQIDLIEKKIDQLLSK